MLNDTINIIGNSIQFDATIIMNRNPAQIDRSSGYGYISPLEILNGRPTIYMCIKFPGKMEECLMHEESESNPQFDFSIFEKFCQLDDTL